MKHLYTTLFDKNYLASGLTMINSLIHHTEASCTEDLPGIYVLAMDDETAEILQKLKIPVNITPISLVEQVASTVELRESRTWQEYCWTMASIYTRFVAINYEEASYADTITYLDSDMMFFSSPQIIHDEMEYKKNHIGVIPHRFNSEYHKKYGANGRFNVSWVTFGGKVGRECLNHWAAQCYEWCFYKNDGDRFGDQKYLDRWPELYPGEVCEISNPGAGLAPWNQMNYLIALQTEWQQVCVAEHPHGQYPPLWTPLVFYHYHQYIHGGRRTLHKISHYVEELIYKPYDKQMERAHADISLVRD